MLIPAPSFPGVQERVSLFMLDHKRHRDDVHDFVYLNEIERAVLDTPEVQRLRHIKQLGFAYLIYPTAEHSRFVHSCGVCHVAKLLVDSINRNHRTLAERIIGDGTGASVATLLAAAAIEEDSQRSPTILWAQRVCIGLAALLHDLPHPPMSHALEHESSAMLRHDDLSSNPQLFEYLFGESSGVARTLREYSPRFANYLSTSERLKLKFGKSEIAEFIEQNQLRGTESLLGGLVFEILAFQAPEKHPRGSFQYARSWGGRSQTFYFSKFFRVFFADLISNTICADLIDYLLRDAMNTGVQKGIDLKFLDRMFIKYPPEFDSYGPTRDARVVFDLHHSHGGLRKDAVSDLLSLLESRYSLMERVYMHRTKLAASAMLGRAYRMANISPQSLYDLSEHPSDDSFLRFLMSADRPIEVQRLATKLMHRKIYKPLFIIDEQVCAQGRTPVDKKKLIKAFRPSHDENAKWDALLECENRLARALAPQDKVIESEHPFVVFCMEEHVAYKDPRVLVELPSQAAQGPKGSSTEVRAIPDVRGILHLLKDFTSDAGAQSQIAAMLSNYDTLWKLYVFADMEIVQKYVERVPAVYAALVETMNVAYSVAGWWQKLRFDGKTFTMPDLMAAVKSPVTAVSELKSTEQPSEPAELLPFLRGLTGDSQNTWKKHLRGIGISKELYPTTLAVLKPKVREKVSGWWNSQAHSDNEYAELKAWVIQELKKIHELGGDKLL